MIETIRLAENAFLTAIRDADIEKLDNLMHQDLLFIIPGGDTITKSIDLENYQSGNMKVDEISANDQQINLIGDNAVTATIVSMKGSFFDYAFDGTYKIIRIWKLQGENWKVIGGSSTPL